MNRNKIHARIEEWRTQVWNAREEIDPYNERDWYDMAVGFFLGKGELYTDALVLADECQSRRIL